MGAGEQWIVARTKPSRDMWAAENVARQGYGFYLPRIIVKNKRYTRAEPLFPSYLFVLTGGPWHFLLNTFGVSSVIMDGINPATVREAEIIKMRKLENAEGFIDLPKPPGTSASGYEPGQSVRVQTGLLQGRVGIYEGSLARDRVKVLFEYLGHQTSVIIDESQIEPA